MSSRPDQYAVFGHPVAHSLSPAIHAQFALQTGQNMAYQAIDPGVGGFADGIQQFARQGGRGANVTLPFKLDAAKWVDCQTKRAASAGAVNTLIRQADGTWQGDNTDGVGLTRDITERLNFRIAGCKVLILGAGGATQGIMGPLMAERPDACIIANRTLHKARELATVWGPDCQACALHEPASFGPFDLIIHTTSSGHSSEALKLDDSIISSDAVCYDISYGRAAEPFLNWARTNGAAQVSDGLGMLIEQAAESFWIWRGKRPDTSPVFKQLAA